MTKREFIDRFQFSGLLAIDLAQSLPYVTRTLPRQFLCSIFPTEASNDLIDDECTVKIWGGRIVKTSGLKRIEMIEAGKYLWVNGKIPAWINLCVVGSDDQVTELEVTACRRLVLADVDTLEPDYGMERRNRLVPFRLRGPSPEGWESAARDA